MPSALISFPPAINFGRRALSIFIPGEPTPLICLILFFSMMMSTGPMGGAPVPLIIVTPRMINCSHGPSPSFLSGAFVTCANAKHCHNSAAVISWILIWRKMDNKNRELAAQSQNFACMPRHAVITKDGSHTIIDPGMNSFFHSLNGAIQESRHVFIDAGLNPLIPLQGTLHIFEMGFGTGLNALLSLVEAEKKSQPVYYCSIDLYPLEKELLGDLNYCAQPYLTEFTEAYEKIKEAEWEQEEQISPHFRLLKLNEDLTRLSLNQRFHLIYFDAFAPSAQPELWTKAIFEKLFQLLLPGGILVTYSSKGEVRRSLGSAGFNVEKLGGPRGKREMVRGRKLIDDN